MKMRLFATGRACYPKGATYVCPHPPIERKEIMSLKSLARPLRRDAFLVRTLGLAAAMLMLVGGTSRPPAAERPFTVVMLPDTQLYSKNHPHLFHAQTEWVRTNREAANIVFVTHVGDIVQDRSKVRAQWEVASQTMARLDGVVPWGVAIGNHDYDSDRVKQGEATMWLEYFGPQRFQGRAWYGGASPNGLNSCQLFSGGGLDFVALHLELNAPDAALEWARSVLRQHPQRAALMSTHAYLRGREGVGRHSQRTHRPEGNSAEEIWTKFIRNEPQIFLVLCGHESRTVEYHQISTNAAGHPVLEVLADYQSRTNGGDGWLRLLEFRPAARQIQVRTWSPALNRFETDADSEFVLPWVMPEACWRRR